MAPDVATVPPILTSADPLAVRGEDSNGAATRVEVFGDDGDGPAVYQGYTDVPPDDVQFRHELPVLGLRFVSPALEPGSAVTFSADGPVSHVATTTPGATSVLSDRITASNADPLFDVARGNLRELATIPGGGVDLGEVVCLAQGIAPDQLPVIDPDVPEPGSGFFYVSRRRSSMAAQPGTYDPAVCHVDGRSFVGPREASSGDCGM